MSDPIARIRDGDRDAAAVFVLSSTPHIRRRYRQRLDRSLRRLCDSNDLVATILRRLDRLVAARAVRADSAKELWSLILRIADNAIVDKSRLVRRVRRIESIAAGSQADTHRVHRRDNLEQQHPVESLRHELTALVRAIPDPVDRDLVTLWLLGNNLTQSAIALNMEPAAARKRWQRLRLAMRDQFERGSGHDPIRKGT